MATIEFDGPYTLATIEILADETFDLPQQLLVREPSGRESPLDLTEGGVVPAPTLDLFIRPRLNHTALIKRLSTDVSIGGIVIDDAVAGKIGFYVEQPVVAAELPVGAWEHFLVRTIGARRFELYRGPFIVHPARIS